MTSNAEEDPQPVPVFHSHCDTCFDIKCLIRPQPGVACDMVKCPKDCGSRYHACKADDHTVLCPNVRVACTNAWYGCQKSKTRLDIKNHLQHCPANVVVCGEEVHKLNYHDHFCSEDHDHSCEPRLVKWVHENTQPTEQPTFQFGDPDEDLIQQYEEIYGPRTVQHKSRQDKQEADNNANPKNNENNKDDSDGKVKNTDNPEDEGDNDKKESNNNAEHDSRFDYLHTVPWQYRQSLTSEANDSDSLEAAHPDLPCTLDETTDGAFTDDDPNTGLEGLPIIVLQQIFRYLDASQLALLAVTSKHLRNVASSLLQEKGMVEMSWAKRAGSWQITKKIWHFGSMTIKVDSSTE